MESTNYPIDEFAILANNSFLYWKIVKRCLENAWIQTKDVESFATIWLVQYSEEEEYRIALLADANFYPSDLDVVEAVEKLALKEDLLPALDADKMWMFAQLSSIYASKYSDDEKYRDIQDVINSFEVYPEDLYYCYEYRVVSPLDPRSSMNMNEILDTVIHQLQQQLSKYKRD